MNSQLTIRIHRHMATFSKGQKRIANYILENYDKVAFMTASKLGAEVGVSESTVVRFATEVGYAGYPELQKAIQEMIRTKMTSFQRLDMAVKTHHENENVLSDILTKDAEFIHTTLVETDEESFLRAAETIANAKTLYIIGVRSSNALATFLAYYMKYIADNVVQINATSAEEIYEQLIKANEDDVIIGISFPRYSARAVKALKYASNMGAKTVAITDSPASPLSELADFLLLARSDMASFVDTLVAPLSLINALIVQAAITRKDHVAGLFEKLENIWDQYGVYEKVEE